MARTLTVLFCRDPSRDRQCGTIRFEGYQVCWPDGRAVHTGLDGFCKHGQRLLGLGRPPAGGHEHLIELTCFPLTGRKDALTRLPGYRVRRFFLERQGRCGRIHFLDGTPTEIVFEIGSDEHQVLDWIGLSTLGDCEQQWMDLAARVVAREVVARQTGP